MGQNCPAEHNLACGSLVRALNLAMRFPRLSICASVAHDPACKRLKQERREGREERTGGFERNIDRERGEEEKRDLGGEKRAIAT